MFYEKATNGNEKDHLEHLLPAVAAYVDRMSEGDFKGDLQKSPVDTASQLVILIQLTQARIGKGYVTKAFSECIDESLKGIEFDGAPQSPSKTARKYDEAYKRHYVPFMNEHEYILENYLINYIFMSMFPFASVLPFSGIKMYDNYILMVLHYALIKLYLTGMAAFHKSELDEDLVVKLLYSFSRNIESNGDYLRDALMALRQNGYSTMGGMSILMRN
jgi:lysine-N-methylase